MAVDHNNPQSRDEEILIATIDGKEYDKAPQSRMEELLLELKETIEEGGGGGGTTNYENLSNQPQVNGETLIGDKTGADLGLVDAEEGKGLSTNDYDDTEKAAVAAATSAISGMLDGSDIDSFGDVETALSAIKDGSELDSFGDVEVALLDKADTSDLGTAADKDSTNAVTSGSTDLVESGAVKDAIDAAVAAAYHHAGTKTVAQLTHDLLIAANEGNVYNITDSGTTTSDFIEGIGKQIDAGDNVGICKVGDVYMFDLLSGLEDTSIFVQKSQTAGLLKNDGTVNTTIESVVAGNTAAIATKQPITDNTLQTVDKTIPGAINEVKSGLTNLDNEVNGDATVYSYADVITIEDAVPANLADCNVKIEPVQDLHGYDKPWVGGAGKNKLPLTVDSIKALNSGLTWNGNTAIKGGVPFTILTDSDNNVLGIKALGTSTAQIWYFNVAHITTTETLLFNTGNTYSWDGNKIVCEVTDGTNTYHASTLNGVEVPAGTYDVVIAAQNNATVDVTFLPMLRATTETDAKFAPYTNLCPISGHTEVDVQRDGKNLVDKSQALSGYMLNQEDGEAVSGSLSTYVTNYIRVFANKPVYVPNAGSTRRWFYDLSKNGISQFPNTYVFTPEADGYIRITGNTYVESGISVDDLQIEYGTQPTPYEPYAGKTYTIALGSTIYGGTVDFDSGVMTVTKAYDTVSNLSWTKYNSLEGTLFRGYITDIKAGNVNTGIVTTSISSAYPSVANVSRTNHTLSQAPSQVAVDIIDNDFDDAAVFKSTMGDVEICYELATPTTIQLTPQQIQLLKGTNTITASTGQISVTVNGVSGAIGSVQTQANATDAALAELAANIAEQLPDAPTTDGTYSLQVTVASGVPTYSWVSNS